MVSLCLASTSMWCSRFPRARQRPQVDPVPSARRAEQGPAQRGGVQAVQHHAMVFIVRNSVGAA